MQRPTIEIRIKDGKATVHTQGVSGEGCTALTAALTRRLFGPNAQPEVQLTSEFFGQMEETDPIATAQAEAAA